MRLLIAALALIFAAPCIEAQAVRFDSASYTVNAQCVAGKQCPVLAQPGTQVNFCTGSGLGVANTAGTVVTSTSGPGFTGASGSIQIAGTTYEIATVVSSSILVLTTSAGTQTGATYSTVSGCLASPATTYTDSGAGTPCATTSQLTPALGGACLSTADNQGNYGAWVLPGSYYYYLRVPVTAGGGTFGPYPISIGASTGCPLGAVCDANYATLALACAAAGSGTLYVTRVWNTPTGSCPTITFLGNGKIVVATGATFTVSPNFIAGNYQRIFDVSASGSSIAFSGAAPTLNPNWFGADWTGVGDSLPAWNAAVAFSGHVFTPKGNYVTPSGPFQLPASNQSVECEPGSKLSYTGTGAVTSTLLIGTIGSNTWNQATSGSCVIVGNSHTTKGAVYLSGPVQSHFGPIQAWNTGGGGNCFFLENGNVNTFEHVMVNGNGGLNVGQTQCVDGLHVEGEGLEDVFVQTNVDHVSGIGINLGCNGSGYCSIGLHFLSGGVEGDGNGLFIAHGGYGNSFSLDFEANAGYDVTDAAAYNYYQIQSSRLFHFTSQAYKNIITSSNLGQLTLDAGALQNSIYSSNYDNAGGQTITDTPTNLTYFLNVNDQNGGARYAPTFTPVLQFGGSSTGITYSTQAGDYTFDGETITARINISVTSLGSATGVATIGGLPVPAGSGVGPFGATFALVTNIPGATTQILGQLNAGASIITVDRVNTAGSPIALVNTDFASTSQLAFTITYRP